MSLDIVAAKLDLQVGWRTNSGGMAQVNDQGQEMVLGQFHGWFPGPIQGAGANGPLRRQARDRFADGGKPGPAQEPNEGACRQQGDNELDQQEFPEGGGRKGRHAPPGKRLPAKGWFLERFIHTQAAAEASPPLHAAAQYSAPRASCPEENVLGSGLLRRGARYMVDLL